MEKILFGIIGWNIAETTRMIEVAKAFRPAYDCHFFSYGGQFEHLVEENDFRLHHLTPIETPDKLERIWKIDRGEAFQQPWSYDELQQRIKNEITLIQEIQPQVVFQGSVLTLQLSCRIAKVPLVSVIPLALSRPYIEARLPVSPFLPKGINRLACYLIEHIPFLVHNFRKVAGDYHLPKPGSLLDLWEGDLNFVTETQELSLLKTLPEGWYFSGPIFAKLTDPIPDEVKEVLLNHTKPIVFFAMGSSANHAVLMKVLSAFEGLDVKVIAPIASHLKEGDEVPENVMVTGWLPALQVTEKVDMAVIHGGQGTVQTTVTAGVPFVGIGMQQEQELNVFVFQQFGNAMLLSRYSLTREKIQQAILTVLDHSQMKEKAQEARQILQKGDAAQTIFTLVNQMILGERPFPSNLPSEGIIK